MSDLFSPFPFASLNPLKLRDAPPCALLLGLLLKAGQKCQRSDSEPKKDRTTDCRFQTYKGNLETIQPRHITEGKAKVKIMHKPMGDQTSF